MATVDTEIVRLSDLVDGQEAECFAALVRKVRGTSYKNETFYKCYFRDKFVTLEAPIWADSRFLKQAETWAEGIAYRLRVRAALEAEVWPATRSRQHPPGKRGRCRQTATTSSSWSSPVSTRPDGGSSRTIHQTIDKCIDEPHLKQLVVVMILEDNAELFKEDAGRASFHHGYTAGLIEHVWSMTPGIRGGVPIRALRRYYDKLNPPLNKGVVVAAAILHDIGKLRELDYHPVEARYTTEGSLIGHVLIGRDMVRETAAKIEGFPSETLLLLEHAILSHHGRKDYGAHDPCLQTIEAALLVSVHRRP